MTDCKSQRREFEDGIKRISKRKVAFKEASLGAMFLNPLTQQIAAFLQDVGIAGAGGADSGFLISAGDSH